MKQPRLKKPLPLQAPPNPAGDLMRGTTPSDTKTLTLLLVHEQAEEIKQTTICMRQVYPGCRVEAVYSAEEALEWGPKQDWGIILLDEQLACRSARALLAELRRQAPSSVIIVQAEHHDTKTAAKAIRDGADLFLYKKSPAFLTELPIATRGVLEQRALQKSLAAERERHSSLIEHFPGLLYELDADGRIVAIGTEVMALLGYSSQELTGTHYSTLLHPDEWQSARHHLHERRTGLRAQHDKAVRLIGKHGGVVSVACQTAGFYNRQRQFLGTIGIIKHSGMSSAPTLARPYRRSTHAEAFPLAAHAAKEPQFFYPERRRTVRVSVQMEASLNLRDAALPGFVRDISLSDLYVVIEGVPSIVQNQPVRLDFSLEGAILEVHGKIAEIRRPVTPVTSRQATPLLGFVIIYTELGVIERPVLSSLIQELCIRPNCAQLLILPAPVDPYILKKNP